MATFLSDKNIGDIVKISENGIAVNYIIVHKGIPGSLYDSSCDGVWVLRQKTHSTRAWNGTTSGYDNDYENSDIRSWLNGTFIYELDYKIRAAIKTVKIPYKKGVGNASTEVMKGSNGLSCRVFLLSGYEVGFTTSTSSDIPVDGAKLSYFSDNASRMTSNSAWWLRSPDTVGKGFAWLVNADGTHRSLGAYHNTIAVRPAFVLPSNLLVTSDGSLSTNTLPTITSNKKGDLGTLTKGFTCTYSVNDEDASDSVSVTLTMDSASIKSFAASKRTQYTYSLTGNDWLKTTNGLHTFKISASDGKDTVTSTATFTRACNALMVTLNTPLPADDVIRACSIKIDGLIPADAVCAYEVTNNANDMSPVWEDCTTKVKAGLNYMFKNAAAENGFALNIRIMIRRGLSGTGGYITAISGGFE